MMKILVKISNMIQLKLKDIKKKKKNFIFIIKIKKKKKIIVTKFNQ